MATIGTALRSARENAGLSQAEAARRAGYKAPTSLNRIERGKMNPELATLLKLVDIYGVKFRIGDICVDAAGERRKA